VLGQDEGGPRTLVCAKPTGEEAVGDLETSTLRHYLGVLWRRRWLLLAPLLLLPAVEYPLSKRQPAVFETSAQVLLNHQDQVATSLVGVQTPSEDAARYAQTQVLVAATPTLARRVLAAAGLPGRSPQSLLDSSSLSTNADVLVITVRDGDPDVAARLATAYARQYTLYRRQLDTRELGLTLAQLEDRLATLRSSGTTAGPLYTSLAEKAQDIRLLEALRQSNVYVVRTPSGSDASKIAPRPLRNTALALGVGLILGLVAAFLVDALDTRIRSVDELEERLGLPLLARVPYASERLRGDGAAPVLADERPEDADAFLALRTRLALANVDLRARALLVASPRGGEGAAAVAARLGEAAARTGSDVLVVDLDLRNAWLTRRLGLDGRAGITSLAIGEATLGEVLVPLEPAGGRHDPHPGVDVGPLRFVPTGPPPARPGEFVASAALAGVLSQLRTTADVVLISAPPLLEVGDAAALAASADALLLVSRRGAATRPQLNELRRALASWPTPALGFVLTDRDAGSGAGTGLRRRLSRRRTRAWLGASGGSARAERTAESSP
jgi:Mrp family chromosome partitioning ATPase/capsular polysaccharide biosynthesis protein